MSTAQPAHQQIRHRQKRWRSHRSSHVYGGRSRLMTLAFPDGKGNQSWTYTPDGLPASIGTNNASGTDTVTNGYTYNRRRLLTQETMAPDTVHSWALGTGYNANGHLTSHVYPAGLTATYTVNALGQVTQIAAQDGTTVNVVSGASYFPNGALKGFTYGNGIIHTTVQHVRPLPAWIGDCTAAGSCLYADRVVHLQLAYDRNGNTASITDHAPSPGQTRGMSYDGLDRLTQTTSTVFGTANYTYDVLDNLTRVQVGASALHPARDHGYCYSDNRLTAVRTSNCSGSLVESLDYDVQGNITAKGSQGFTFDFGNRLRTSGTSAQYRYDGHGRRVRHTTSGTAPYLYSQYDVTGQLRWQRDEQAGQRIRNLYLGNRLVAEHRKPIGVNAVTIEYLHVDGLGSPIARTDAGKAIIQKSEFEPYGRLINRNNDDRPGYTGHVMDAATGLTYMQERYYDPQLGLFLSVDPVTAYQTKDWRLFHRYGYAFNNPYSFTDSDGRLATDDKKEPPPPPPEPKTLETVTVTAPRPNVVSGPGPNSSPQPRVPSFFRLTTTEALRRDRSSEQAIEDGELTRTVTFPAMIVTASPNAIALGGSTLPVTGEATLVIGSTLYKSKTARELFFGCLVGIGVCQGGRPSMQRINQQERLQQAREGSMRETRQRATQVP